MGGVGFGRIMLSENASAFSAENRQRANRCAPRDDDTTIVGILFAVRLRGGNLIMSVGGARERNAGVGRQNTTNRPFGVLGRGS